MTSLQDILTNSIVFLNGTIIPLLFALAFLFFLVNVLRYFIIGGGNEEGRKKAKMLATWGIIAFVVMVSIWGIVNVLVSSFVIPGIKPICPDFFPSSACVRYQAWDPESY